MLGLLGQFLAGGRVTLDASGTTDPDENHLS